MAVMELFGLLTNEDEKAGFKLILDEHFFVRLLSRGRPVAAFDPRDYTASELRRETAMAIQGLLARQGNGKSHN